MNKGEMLYSRAMKASVFTVILFYISGTAGFVSQMNVTRCSWPKL
jgi:hypothetical protein